MLYVEGHRLCLTSFMALVLVFASMLCLFLVLVLVVSRKAPKNYVLSFSASSVGGMSTYYAYVKNTDCMANVPNQKVNLIFIDSIW